MTSSNTNKEPASPSKQGLKLALIPILGGILLFVVLGQGDDGPTQPPVALKAVAPQPQAINQPIVAERIPSKSTAAPLITANVVWPTTSLDDVLSTNPFHTPPNLMPVIKSPIEISKTVDFQSSSENELDETTMASIQDALGGRKVKALVQSSRGAIAMIGDDVVRVGDLVGDRLKVTDIRSDGIVVELVPESDNEEEMEVLLKSNSDEKRVLPRESRSKK